MCTMFHLANKSSVLRLHAANQCTQWSVSKTVIKMLMDREKESRVKKGAGNIFDKRFLHLKFETKRESRLMFVVFFLPSFLPSTVHQLTAMQL